jgi:hypothetical protein
LGACLDARIAVAGGAMGTHRAGAQNRLWAGGTGEARCGQLVMPSEKFATLCRLETTDCGFSTLKQPTD